MSWRVRIVALFTAAVAAIPAALLATGGPAAAYAPVSGNITADHNGLCLDIAGGPQNIADGAELNQWECLGRQYSNQIFTLEEVRSAPGYWRIKPTNVGSTKCLDVVGGPGATQNTARVQRFTCLGDDQHNQQFRIVADTAISGRYQLRARHSDKCLDVIGGPSGGTWGRRVQQYDCLGPTQHNQYFHLYGFPGF